MAAFNAASSLEMSPMKILLAFVSLQSAILLSGFWFKPRSKNSAENL